MAFPFKESGLRGGISQTRSGSHAGVQCTAAHIGSCPVHPQFSMFPINFNTVLREQESSQNQPHSAVSFNSPSLSRALENEALGEEKLAGGQRTSAWQSECSDSEANDLKGRGSTPSSGW